MMRRTALPVVLALSALLAGCADCAGRADGAMIVSSLSSKF